MSRKQYKAPKRYRRGGLPLNGMYGVDGKIVCEHRIPRLPLAAFTAPSMSLALLLGWIAESWAVTVAPFQRSVALIVRADAGDQSVSGMAIESKIAGMK